VTTPGAPGGAVDFRIRRSKGFEGMAASKDGSKLYALLEGPVWNAEAKDYERVEGKAIADPNKLARKPLHDGVLKFPFFTIENVEVVDAAHIVVGNDNNLPFSSSREPNKADDNELVLLEAGELLRAK
jgi:hypothetical protein